MVLFDSDFLCFLLLDDPGVIAHPRTRKPVERAKEKIEHLISSLAARREKVILPTPALSEILCLAADHAHEVLAALTGTYRFQLAAFDVMAAVEAAMATAKAIAKRDKKGGSKSTWAKVKFDRQIVAIAKTRGVAEIYSNDEDIRRFAKKEGMKVISVWDLPDPPPEQGLLPHIDDQPESPDA
jgi:predicted nucleic acid-binding protein